MRVSLALCILAPLQLLGQAWSGVLAPNRATDWTQAGIPGYSLSGSLPSDTWTQCGSTIAAYGSSGTPASPATINTAVTSCSGTNKYVLLGPGDFYLNGAIYNRVSGVEVRGSGPLATRLHYSAASGCQNGAGTCLIGFATTSGNYPGSPGTVVNWTAGYSQGATSITVSDGSILSNNTMIVLDQCDTGFSGTPCTGSAVDNGNLFNSEAPLVWSGTPYASSYTGVAYRGPLTGATDVGGPRQWRGREEFHKVVSCSPACGTPGTTTVTITPGLIHSDWSSGQNPQAWVIPPVTNVGVRDLTVIGSNLSYGAVTTGIGFSGAMYFWVRNVIFDSLPNITLYITQGALGGDIQSNYFYNSAQGTNNDSSGINYYGDSSIISNNIGHKYLIWYVGNGPGSGNVLSYNYAINAQTGNGTLSEALDNGHSNGVDYNLYEGNITAQIASDQAHGNSLAITLYRNMFYGWESCANGNCGTDTAKNSLLLAIDGPISNHRYWSAIANLLGTPGVTTAGYQLLNQTNWFYFGTTGYVYNVGAGNTAAPPSYNGPIPPDTVVASTLYRWGNWDAFNGVTRWVTGEVPTSPPGGILANPVPTTTCTSSLACPPSFYLSSRPSWYPSSIPFPLIGPDVTGGNVGQCGGTANTHGQYALVAATNASQCAGQGLNTAWAGHVNANPAMACYLSLGGLPDGTGGKLNFDANTCYPSTPPSTRPPSISVILIQ